MRQWLIVLATVSSGFCFSQGLDLSKAKNQMTFLAIGQPSALRIKGSAEPVGETQPFSGQLRVEGTKLTGTVVVQTASLNTGIALRDKHMKEKYLEVEKFPTTELALSDVSLGEGNFKGQLKLHGVTKEVQGKATAKNEGGEVKLNLEFPLLLQDYGIEIPNYLGIKVANEVKVTAISEGKLQ